jgi:hypothetical protein
LTLRRFRLGQRGVLQQGSHLIERPRMGCTSRLRHARHALTLTKALCSCNQATQVRASAALPARCAAATPAT